MAGLSGAYLGLENINILGPSASSKTSAAGPVFLALGITGIVGGIVMLNAAAKTKQRAQLMGGRQTLLISPQKSMHQSCVGVVFSIGK